MYIKNKAIMFLLLLLLLTTTIFLTGCGGDSTQQKDAVQDYLKTIENKGIYNLKLTIFYIDPQILTRAPLTVNDLINFEGVTKIIIDGNELEKHTDLLRQLDADKLNPIKKKSSVDARIYYVFETSEGNKVLDVTMWGHNAKCSVFVNGLEVNYNDVFIDIIMPFLPQTAKNNIESYLSMF